MTKSDRAAIIRSFRFEWSVLSKLALGLCLLLALLVSLHLSGCALAKSPDYPAIPTSGQKADASAAPRPVETGDGLEPSATREPLAENQIIQLRVAGNWEASTVQLMANYQALLAAEESTLTAEQQGGDQIDPDWLAAYHGRLQIIQVPLPGGVLTSEQAALWTAADNWPDLVQTQSYYPTGEKESPFIDLSIYLQDEANLSADRTFASLVHISQGRSFSGGVPYRVSLPVVFYKQSLLDQLQLDVPSREWTWQAFQQLLDETSDRLNRENLLLDQPGLQTLLADTTSLPELTADSPIAPSLGIESLLDYRPGMQAPELGIAAWDGRNFAVQDPSFVESIRDLQDMGAQGSTLFDVNWPDSSGVKRLTDRGQAVFWLGLTSDLSATQSRSWQIANKNQDDLGWAFLPRIEDDRVPRYPVVLDTLAVSNSCLEPEAAARLAVFMALDPNAQLLATRLDWKPGTFPVIRDAGVWTALARSQMDDDSLLRIQTLLDSTFSDGRYQDPAWEGRHQLLARALPETLLPAEDLQQALEQVDLQVNP